jgi:glucose/arabinose dehydrogenase
MKKLVLILIPAAVLFVLIIIFSLFKNSPSKPISPASLQTSGISPAPTSTSNVKISAGEVPSIAFSLPSGFIIHIFATGLGTPRDLQFTPGGTLLVSDPNTGIVYALPDRNNDGVTDNPKIIISGEKRPHGLAFYQNKLYIADVDKVVRYNWDESTISATYDKDLFTLPENNDHNNRTIVFDKSGRMYVSVGSTCNVCSETSMFSATIVISDANGNNPTVFAKGLRNAAYIQIDQNSGELWGTEMGRDYLGDNLPPDEINIIRDGADYGWPNCYGDKIPDLNFNPRATCQNTQTPIYEIPAHSAPLGLTFINSSQFPDTWQGDLLVAYHGSWNRSTPTGYKITHLNVNGNSIAGSNDFITGFIPAGTASGTDSLGRPVDLTFDILGNLYISDDKAGNVYIVQKNI